MNTLPLATFVDVGPLVFLTGRTASDEHDIVSGDTAAQTRCCLERIDCVLQDLGLSSSSVIECMIWLGHRADEVAFKNMYSEHFGSQEPKHFLTTCQLPVAGALVEIDVTACRGGWSYNRSHVIPPRKRPFGRVDAVLDSA